MLSETAITVSGLPGTVSVAQITKMFGDFGTVKNITFSPYQMLGHSMMNAIVTVALKQENVQNVQKTESRTESVQDSNSGFSFQENEVKDRSVDKEEIKTMRRGGMGGGGRGNIMNQGQGQTHSQRGGNRDNRVGGGIDPDVLAKEIDELLADTDSEDDKDSDDDSDSDIDLSTTESDSDSDSDSEDTKK